MPFTVEDLRSHPLWAGLSDVAQEFLTEALRAPSRDVSTGGFPAVSGAYPSRKVGVSIPFESRSAELAFAVHMEFDDDVLAYFNQLPRVEVHRTRASGARYLTSYVADFLVIRRCMIRVVQVKPEKDLQRLVDTRAEDWFLVEGRYVDRPATEAFEAMGLTHEVVSTDSLNRYRTANYQLLIRARDEAVACDDRTRARARAELKARMVISLAELAKAVGISTLSPLLQLIDEGELIADLEQTLISSPETCWVSTSRLYLDTHREESVVLRSHGPINAAEIPSEKRAARALKIIEAVTAGEVTKATTRLIRILEGRKAQGQTAFQAALPNWHRSGNRVPRRPGVVMAFAEHVIRQRWARPERPSARGAFSEYRERAKDWHPGLQPISKPTFLKLLHQLEAEASSRRSGLRGANAAASPSAISDRVIPPMRPFERATCDHYLVDMSCVVTKKGDRKLYTRRPWFTVLRDIATGMIIAFWLSFARPNRTACASVLRSCLRRHGRLPESIIVDRGAEFTSVFFRSLLASLEIELVLRPAGHPRYGSEAERIFGQLKERWLDGRPGNWGDIKEVRSVSGSHRPEATATLTVLDLLTEIDDFIGWFARWGTNHSDRSPQEALETGLERFPFSGRLAVYGPKFELETAVDVSSYTLDKQRGIKIHPHWYWAPELADPSLKRGKIQVRKDPENPYTIYALVRDQWITCFASLFQRSVGQTLLQRMAEAVLNSAPNSQFADAIEDAESELVALKRAADERVIERTKTGPKPSHNAKEPRPEPPKERPIGEQGGTSIWSQLRELDFGDVPTGKWGKP